MITSELFDFIMTEFLRILTGNLAVFALACLVLTILVIIILDRIF